MSARAEPERLRRPTFWAVTVLIGITVAVGGLAVLLPDRHGGAVSVVWVGLALLALACWFWSRSRWLSRALLVVVAFGWARPLLATLVPRRPAIEGDISSHLLGYGAAGHWRLSAAVLALVTEAGKRPGWSRDGLYELRPAGDMVVGVEGIRDTDGTLVRSVVLLRGSDGALLWRWRLKDRAPEVGIISVTADPDRAMVAVQVRHALIGLDFSGQVRYRRALPELMGTRERWRPVSDHLRDSRRLLQTDSVLVLTDDASGSSSTFAAGFDVASGAQLWQLGAPVRDCSFAQASGPGPVSYLLVGGHQCPITELSRWDGAVPSFTVRVRPPGDGEADAVNPGLGGPPDLSIVDADRVAVNAFWEPATTDTGPNRLFGRDSRVYDAAGSETGEVPASVRLFLAYAPVPTTKTPRGGLGVLLSKKTGGLSWLAMSPRLEQISRSPVTVGDSDSVIHRAGADLIIYRRHQAGAGGAVSLLAVGPTPKVRETIRTAGLAPCGSGFDAVDGDESLLTLRCGSTGFVRPLS